MIDNRMGDGCRSSSPPGFLRRLDGRVKLPLLLAACLFSQYVPTPLLPCWLLLLLQAFWSREMRTAPILAMLRGGLYFIAFWLVVKMVSDVGGGAAWLQAAAAALPLGGRLFALTVIGMTFVGFSTPMETGRAAAWYMWPVLGRRAWKPALAVALTAWFLPVTLRLAAEVSEAARARGLRLSWSRKTMLIVGASLRILDRKADEIAVGLASRRLDDPRSWRK